MKLEIELNGDVQLSRKLLRFADAAQDASPAFRAIIDQLEDSESRQFDTSGSYGSGGWRPLAPSTVLRKMQSDDPRIRANATTVWQGTGDTMRSLTGNAPGSVRVVQPHQLTYGTTIPQARYHQPDPQGRRVLELPETARKNVVRTLQAHLARSLRDTGGAR